MVVRTIAQRNGLHATFMPKPFIESILGEHIYQQYVSSKEQEWRNYNNVIHPWELDNYLGIY